MADFIINRKTIKTIPVDPYPFPDDAFQIYGNGRFYNGFSIGDRSKLSVVNSGGVLKFSRWAANAYEDTTVILGTIPKNTKDCIYIDIASPLSENMTSSFKIGDRGIPTNEAWTKALITHTDLRYNYIPMVQDGGVLSIYFKSTTDLPEIDDLLEVRAIWIN